MAHSREQVKAYKRAHYLAHRATVLDRVKRYADDHAEKVKAYKKKWEQKHKAEIAAKKHARYAANKRTISAKYKARYAADSQPFKQKSKAYRTANPDAARTAVRRWCKANPVRLAAMKLEWQRADYHRHPEKYKEIQGRRKAQKLQTQTEKVDFVKVLMAANGVCGICKKPFDLFGIDFDHIVPLSRGGPHTTDNLQATHSRCNRAKGAKVG